MSINIQQMFLGETLSDILTVGLSGRSQHLAGGEATHLWSFTQNYLHLGTSYTEKR